MFIAPDYLDLTQTDHPDLFPPGEQVWTTLTRIGGYLETRLTPGCQGSISAGAHVGERVFIGEGTVVEPGAVIKGPRLDRPSLSDPARGLHPGERDHRR